MRPLLVLFAIAALGAAPPARLTSRQLVEAREVSRLAAEAERQWAANERAKALVTWEARHKKLVALVGRAHHDVLTSLTQRAVWLVSLGRYKEAAATLAEYEAVSPDLYGATHWDTRQAAAWRRDLLAFANLSPGTLIRVSAALRRLDQANAAAQRRAFAEAASEATHALEELDRAAPGLTISSERALSIAASLVRAEQVSLAIPLLRTSSAGLKKCFGAHLRTGLALHLLGYCLQESNRAAESIPYYREALAVRWEVLGKRDGETLQTMHNLANALISVGQFAAARQAHLRCLALRRAAVGERHVDVARSLHGLGWLEQEQGRFALARGHYLKALDIFEELLGRRHPLYLLTLNNLGNAYTRLYDFQAASAALGHVLAVRREALGAKAPDTLMALHNLANAEQEAGNLGRARALYEEALAGMRERFGEKHPAARNTLLNLANLYADLRDQDRAIQAHKRLVLLVRSLEGASRLELAQALHSLGYAYQAADQPGPARRAYEECLALVLRHGGPSHHMVAATLGNLANAYRSLGDWHRCEVLHRRSLEATRARLDDRHPLVARGLINLARCARDSGRLDEARRLLDKADALKPPPNVSNIAIEKAGLALFAGKRADGLRHSMRALALVRRTFGSHMAALGARQRLGYFHFASNSVDFVLTFSGEDRPAPVYEAVLTVKGFLASWEVEERELPDTVEARGLLDGLRLARGELAAAAQRGDGEEKLAVLENRKESLEVRLARLSEGYGKMREARRPTLAAIAAALPRGHALVEFVRYSHLTPRRRSVNPFASEPRFVAFVLRPDKAAVLLPLGPAAPIEAAVSEWRKKAQTAGDVGKAGGELRRLLWLPVEKHLAGCKAVLIAPDAGLSGMPFAALPGAKTGRDLLDDYAIGYLTSGRQLLDQASISRPARKGALLLGAPKFGKGPWADLPGTLAEARQVKALYRAEDGAALITGEKATREALLARLRETPPRWLHVATHGYFGPDTKGRTAVFERNPMLASGLVLAGGKRLTAEEVAGLDLRGCELAVLSACETGLGKVAGWQGVQGLQRGFHQAGAQNVCASLWSVNDAATSVLMKQFYTRLWGKKKLSKLEALRQAQLFVRDNPAAVARRATELRRELLARGVSEKVLTGRGLGKVDEKLPGEEGKKRSPAAWWAAWVLTGP
jgi:CHAT domain-containing protein/lipopolysaccharide biosynthesis regulator YciM